jgi:uncharacterized protein (DUF1684 family)
MLMAGGLVVTGQQPTANPSTPDSIVKFHQARDHRLRSDFSPLALVHREYLPQHGQVTLGSSAEATVRLEGLAPIHATIDMDGKAPVLKAVGEAKVLKITDESTEPVSKIVFDETIVPFRLGRYNLLYKFHESWGHIIEVYDLEHPRYREFSGVEFFPYDPAYQVTGEVVPAKNPEQIDLIDSHGNKRPVWVYGTLEFELQRTRCQLELYTDSTDPERVANEEFMLIFTDATSGKETYPAARYLYVEGKAAGPISVDFNRAFSPPCSFSPVWTCPFPRPQNRLPVAIRAGEKWYHSEHYDE